MYSKSIKLIFPILAIVGLTGCGDGSGTQSDSKVSTTKIVYSIVDGITKSKVYMAEGGDYFNISTSGTTVYGSSGNDIVTIAAGISGVTLDQNVERFNLSEASSRYTFKPLHLQADRQHSQCV